MHWPMTKHVITCQILSKEMESFKMSCKRNGSPIVFGQLPVATGHIIRLFVHCLRYCGEHHYQIEQESSVIITSLLISEVFQICSAALLVSRSTCSHRRTVYKQYTAQTEQVNKTAMAVHASIFGSKLCA